PNVSRESDLLSLTSPPSQCCPLITSLTLVPAGLQPSPSSSRAPRVNPTPLLKFDRYPGRMDTQCDLQREIDDLSDEENELEDAIRPRLLFIRIPRDDY
ncbi:hypothetical protein EDB19DRAFT_1698155, partial [Suillus lakei]